MKCVFTFVRSRECECVRVYVPRVEKVVHTFVFGCN